MYCCCVNYDKHEVRNCRLPGMVKISWDHHECHAFRLKKTIVLTPRAPSTGLNSFSRQRGRKPTSSRLTFGVQRCSFTVTCPGLHHLLLRSTAALLLHLCWSEVFCPPVLFAVLVQRCWSPEHDPVVMTRKPQHTRCLLSVRQLIHPPPGDLTLPMMDWERGMVEDS